MKKGTKIGIALTALVVLGGGILYLTLQDTTDSAADLNSNTQSDSTTASSTAGVGAQSDRGATYVSSTSSSDASINQDTAQIDAQLKGLDDDLRNDQ